MSDADTVLVLAAAYDSVEDAEVDYEAIKSLYMEVQTSDDFDAAVIERNEDGEVKVVKKHEQPTRHGAAKASGGGSRWARRWRSSPRSGSLAAWSPGAAPAPRSGP
jgi:uncharacterized membrane protein